MNGEELVGAVSSWASHKEAISQVRLRLPEGSHRGHSFVTQSYELSHAEVCGCRGVCKCCPVT